jgi:GNAT superfamily N-acetyltransferase
VAGLEIRPYAPALAEDVAAVYNRGVHALPYCARLDADYLVSQIAPRFFFHPDGLLIAYRGAAPIGYAHAALAPSADRQGENPALATVAALFLPPDEPAVGAALLAAAERWARDRGAERMLGWGSGATGYPFYRGLLGGLEPVLIEGTSPALGVFRAAGYAPYVASYLLAAPIEGPTEEPSVVGSVEVTVGPRAFAERWDVDAWRGHRPLIARADVEGREVGALLFALMPRLSEQRGAGIGGIAALRVDEPFRRRGIAGLLTARARERLRAEGAREWLVACHRSNAPAIATYRKYGFRAAALMVGHERRLN